ncbi:DUF4041 domain-containing protein [Nocardia africana]|uniref:T5orf172 domain n=1 Tax=Nocardia africana TaxID=134964 RepID=A0A378WNS9_9NOCA|nr:DUF4041 domain-containing protein [Nocardia africana]MCC3314740.1 DUF4041 domain-containing protein [Nocardia africana]SUA42980.1 T5orf172 domain [Nocardia africana]
MNSTPPADWYSDPEDNRFIRYWNGAEWTADRRPVAATDGGPIEHSAGQGSKVPLFGARAHAKRQSQELADLQAENRKLREQLERTGSLEIAEIQQLRDQLASQIASEQALLDELRQEIIHTRDEQMLQEIGIYEYHHPLSNSVNHRAELEDLHRQIKAMARQDGRAIEASTSWVVRGSVTEGRQMVREYSKLMLRAYNAEADNLVRSLKPYKLPTALKRLDKVAFTIERLGRTMDLRVAPEYHRLRYRELEVTAAHLEEVAYQRQLERDERDRQREERKAQQEMARERARIDREEKQYRHTLAEFERVGKGSTSDADRVRDKLKELESHRQRVDYQATNTSAGHVYVISNIGAFGDGMVHIGFTRRFDPEERIRDLSNTAVPFPFDVHVMLYDDDAAGIEAELHRRLADRRVNRINERREFFYATPAEVRELLQEVTKGKLLEFTELAEAVDFRQSRAAAQGTSQE